MLAEKYLRRRYEAGMKEGLFQARKELWQEGFKRGRKEGFEQGFEQGWARVQQLWEAWNRRRLEAGSKGVDFTESPPSLDQLRNRGNRIT